MPTVTLLAAARNREQVLLRGEDGKLFLRDFYGDRPADDPLATVDSFIDKGGLLPVHDAPAFDAGQFPVLKRDLVEKDGERGFELQQTIDFTPDPRPMPPPMEAGQ